MASAIGEKGWVYARPASAVDHMCEALLTTWERDRIASFAVDRHACVMVEFQA